jgi:hypothetical protein
MQSSLDAYLPKLISKLEFDYFQKKLEFDVRGPGKHISIANILTSPVLCTTGRASTLLHYSCPSLPVILALDMGIKE